LANQGRILVLGLFIVLATNEQYTPIGYNGTISPPAVPEMTPVPAIIGLAAATITIK
jgi:hypothetical protein